MVAVVILLSAQFAQVNCSEDPVVVTVASVGTVHVIRNEAVHVSAGQASLVLPVGNMVCYLAVYSRGDWNEAADEGWIVQRFWW